MFLAPVYAGDYIEAYGEIEKIGNTSRTMKFEARKVMAMPREVALMNRSLSAMAWRTGKMPK